MKTKFLSGMLVGIVILTSIISLTLVTYVSATAPVGANGTTYSNQTAPPQMADKKYAYAGNVTSMNVFGFSTTQAWQGYFGNVTGVIELGDGADHIMYNWSLANPRGEVYSSMNSSVIWSNIRCFNYYANGTECDPTEYATGRGTMTADGGCGMNLSQIDELYNINFSSDYDNINNTFAYNNHQLFYTNNLQFSVGECNSTRLYNSTGDGRFDEAIMFSPEMNNAVFVSLLRDDEDGFDAATHDFEMIVPENGHGTDVLTTAYYFYVELY